MPSLRELVNNLDNFRYYSGVGTFNANNLPLGDTNGDQPYITTKPGFRWSPDNFDEGVIRGGLIGGLTRSGADVLRISKFLTDAPRGPLFLAKQVGLQLSNPRLESRNDRPVDAPESGQGFFNNIANAATNFANRIANDIGTTRIYNPLGTNTLAQVGVSAFGKHLVRHGFLPVMNEQDKYINVVRQKDNDGNNRLVGLARKFADQKTGKDGGIIIQQYKGGPGSFLGIGTTTIKSTGTVTSLTGLASNTTIFDRGLGNAIPIGIDYLQKIDDRGVLTQVIGSQPTADGVTNIPILDKFDFRNSDFRAFKNKINKRVGIKLDQSDYSKYNLAQRINTINPNAINYTNRRTDGLNFLSLYYGEAPSGTNILDVNNFPVQDESVIRDMVKFRIKVLDNDDPRSGVYLVFRAFFNGEIQKDIIAKWNPYTYVGRGESFYAYDGTTATLSLSFTIVAFSKLEMKSLYQKLNYLESSMYPDYKANKMRGNIVELTIGDYLKYQPGIINNMSIVIPEDANWEIAINEPENGDDRDMHELPQMLKVSLTFTPIYNFLPRKNSQTPFIGIDDKERKGGPKDWLTNRVEPLPKTKTKR